MSQELQQNRYDQLLRRVGGLIGPGAKVSEVLGELFPVLEVENTVPELRILGGTILGLGQRTSAGVAAVQQHIQLFNPVESGSLISVTGMDVSSDVLQGIAFGLVNSALATATATQRPRDGRVNILNPILGQIRFAGAAVIAPDVGRLLVEGNVGRFLENSDGLFVLPPGFGLQVSTTALNTDLRVTFWWRERPSEASEVNF